MRLRLPTILGSTRLEEPLVARGRPPSEVDSETVADLWKTMKYFGPKTGEPTLRRNHPDYPVGALRREMKRFRDFWKLTHKRHVQRLTWTRPMTVWSMDFAVPPVAMEGGYTAFLVVRDLASRKELCNMPVYAQDTKSTEETIQFYLSLYGPPLVIKSDNGSAFISKDFRRALNKMGVLLLLSPPYCPSYNGSAENAVNEAKTHAAHHALESGCSETWTRDDLAWARERANLTVGADLLTRDERFDKGEPITELERKNFRLAFRAEKLKVKKTMEDDINRKLTRKEHNIADRRALKNALIKSGFLFVEGANYSND